MSPELPFELCPGAGLFDFRDPCVRASWTALLPALFLLPLAFLSFPLPAPVRKSFAFLTTPLDSFLTLQEAEALDAAGDTVLGGVNAESATKSELPLWRTLGFAAVGLAQSLSWIAYGSFRLIQARPTASAYTLSLPFILAVAWLYTVLRSVFRPSLTPPYDIFSLYCVFLLGAIIQLTGVVYDHDIVGASWPAPWVLAALAANLGSVIAGLAVLLGMPITAPSDRIEKEEIGRSVSPEDYTTLFGWITFSWVYPLIRRGRDTTLDESDVWSMSPTMQSRPVFIKFMAIHRSTLLRKLWAANSLDIILDCILTLVSVIFNYTTPFFLKRILDAIDMENRTPESMARAYTYAFLAFICTLLKAQADVQHLWYGRRAATRMRSELMAAIYDKALKRKDLSGIVKDKEQALAPEQEAKSKKNKGEDKKKDENDPKSGADVGKIVNLMAGDANRISQLISGMYFLYGAPFEIIIAGTFLYQLLGISAFAGFIVLLAGWPLNSFVMKRSIKIQKGLLAARDGRMGVLNELIGAIKFIKFFAWEDKWISRVMDAREVEIKWMVKSRLNSVMFYLLWTCAPILVSIISFFVYVMQGKELSVSIAFTSIALFNMIRVPLNIIPAWIVQILQAGVALKRIEVYLEEDEVSDQVSSIKQTTTPRSTGSEVESGFGIVNGSFKWNAVEEKEDDLKDQAKQKKDLHGGSPESTTTEATVITIEAAGDSSSQTEEDHKFELRDIDVMFPEGELAVITGPTASGKTALLMALLGEMTLLPGSGKIVMSKNPGKVDENGHMHAISYAAQSPWLRHQSIRDNILFGYPYEEQRYKDVVECCALGPDLDVLEDGDETEIGARGVSLSGGQKARVALARAVYARTKYVLLDDPLSAVDSHTSRFLYERLLRGPLLENRTVILVTHHVDLVLPGAYYIVRMLDGRIDTQGTVKELQARGILEDIMQDAAVDAQKEEIAVAEVKDETPAAQDEEGENKDKKKKPKKLVKDEHRETGGVKWAIYKSYLKASSYWIWVFLVFIVVLAQLLNLGEKVWIMIWGEAYGKAEQPLHTMNIFRSPEHELGVDSGFLSAYQQPNVLHGIFSATRPGGRFGIEWPDALQHPLFYVGVYAAIGLTNALLTVVSVSAQYTGALRASRILFKKLLVTVVRATFRFHDTTPQGRMLNRFGKDIETIDMSLVGSLQSVNSTLANFFASIITVAVVFPAFLLPAFLLGIGYYQLAVGYLNTGRDLRRMESNTRSPIYSDFGELLEGIVTVRAFSAEKRFLDNLHLKIDITTKMWYSFWMTNRWLLLNFDALSAIAVFLTMLLSIATLSNGAGMAGLCITSAMAFTSSVYWACRFWTALELDLNSVERVVEYLELPQEPPAVIESNRVPAYWPSSSNNNSLITVEDLVVKYAPDLPAVLQDVSFTLRAGERVGLLGRTGSGKSTLAMSMLRFVDPTSGRIFIDGIDISTIGVQDLRSRLTFIPQDATLFSGTLRDNLDPFGEHTDSECLDVLRRVHMVTDSASQSRQPSASSSRAASVRALEREETASVSTATVDGDSKTTVSLETQVSAGGTNFSQGQRQLIAMARALLRCSSIIVLDEATSSIDFATDAKIQSTIREEFNDSLLLTVAHRLRTVIDYDRLIVLDKGKIAEFDTPWKLIQKENGIFRTMCLKSGSFGELEASARNKAERDGQL